MKGTLWAPSRCRGLDKANIQMSNNESTLFDDILLLHALSLTHMIIYDPLPLALTFTATRKKQNAV